MQVHIDRGGERFGPYSLEEVNAYLANGTLLPTDNAWQDGMANWVPIDQIPGVTMAVGSTPPTPSTTPAAGATCPQCQAPVEASQVICMGCGTRLQGEATTPKGSKKKLLIGIGAGVGVLAIIAGIWFFLVREDGTNEQGVETKKSESTPPTNPNWVSDPSDPNNVKIEHRIRHFSRTATGYFTKRTGELTKADLEKVTKLKLDGLGLTSVKGLEKLTQLKTLELEFNQLTSVKGLEKLTQLTYLNLDNNKLTSVKGLEKLTQLELLILIDNPALTEAQIAELEMALPFPKCTIHSNPPLTKEETIEKAIRKAAKKPTGELTKADFEKVTSLDLNHHNLTDVKGLEKLTKLEKLFLHDNKLTDVTGLENLTQLKELSLQFNKLTDVKGLEKLTQLTWLNLANNRLTELKGLEKLTQLKTLNLKNNQLTNVTSLEKLAKLEELYLENNPALTKAQIAELQRALPKCKIFSKHTNPIP